MVGGTIELRVGHALELQVVGNTIELRVRQILLSWMPPECFLLHQSALAGFYTLPEFRSPGKWTSAAARHVYDVPVLREAEVRGEVVVVGFATFLEIPRHSVRPHGYVA